MDIHILWNMYIHCITKYCIRWMYRFLKILCIQWPYWNITSIVLQILHPLYYKYCSTETLHPLYYKHYIHCTTNIVVLKHYIHCTTNIVYTMAILKHYTHCTTKYCFFETCTSIVLQNAVYNGCTCFSMAIIYTVFCSELQNTVYAMAKYCIRWLYCWDLRISQKSANYRILYTMAKYTVYDGYTYEIWEFLKSQLITQ